MKSFPVKSFYEHSKRGFCSYMPKNMDTTEYLDTESVVAAKALKLARFLVSSKKVVCFTGAGISTSSGIPDYRSGYNTIISTGPGAWESEENKQKFTKEKVRVEAIKAIPSKTHMALYELVSRGYIHHIITQNVDGLHRKSGIPEDKLTELHGGTNKEICHDCHKEYLRDFRVRNFANPESEHKTLRKCTNCGSDLYDTVVYFNQPLRMVDKTRALHEAETSDLCLVLGSSLKVSPASRYPTKFINNPDKKLAIVNLQKTHLDKYCDLRIGALTDHVLELAMAKIGIPIPEYTVKRWLSFQISRAYDSSSILTIKNYNKEMFEFSVFKSIVVEANIDNSMTVFELNEEPFEFHFKGNLISLKCHMKFFGNKDEKDLSMEAEDWGPLWDSLTQGREIIVHGEYCLNNKNWDLLEARAL